MAGARARLLGYGERGIEPEQDWYGSENPGHELAQAVLAQRASTRADKEAAALEEERKAQADYRKHQQAREEAMDPITMALARAHLAREGIRGPGQGGGGGGGGVDITAGLPPTGIMAGSRSAPVSGVSSRNASGPMPDVGNRTQGMDSGFLGPQGRDPNAAHLLPGAWNPLTGAHNPADIDLGGGFTLGGAYTPEGRRQSDITGLQGFGFSPEEALYLSQHPEHLAPFIAARERGHAGSRDPYGPESISFHEHMRDYDVAHPLREQQVMSLAGALQEVDRLYGKNMPGGAATTLGADKRMELAQRMTHRAFNPQRMPPTGFGDATARIAQRSGQPQAVQPTAEEATGDEQRRTRAFQLAKIRQMIPKGADPARVREILRQHGVTDEEAEGIANPPAAPTARAPRGGSRF